MRRTSHTRKAYISRGDDNLTRWVKVPTDGKYKDARGSPATRSMPADATGTRYRKRVLPIAKMKGILVSGFLNVKIGRDVRKGRFKGYWIYTLSLEERATCPRSCEHWQSCYGNNMPFAKRVDHTDPVFLPALEAELDVLLAKHKTGVLVRLHALGDFYSEAYLDFWRTQLEKHPRLAIYGYTAHLPDTFLGAGIAGLRWRFAHRFMVRHSNGPGSDCSTTTIMDPADRPDNAFVCPEQTEQTRCCATCGACWSTTKNVAFLAH